jgi:ribonuclease HI
LILNIQTTWNGNSLPNCLDTWAQKEHKHSHLPSLICWTTWLERNKSIFENGTPSISVAAYKALGIYNTWNATLAHKPSLQHTLKDPVLDYTNIGWFDGATLSDGTQSGVGGLIKTTQNTLYKWTFNCGPGTNTRAELLGAWATLYLASRLHIDALQVLGDSKTIIEWLNNREDLQAISLMAWKDKIRMLQPTFKNLIYNHIYREHNNSTDQLSKMALQKKVGILNYSLWIDGHEGPPST